ncbi:unnamed protein product [Trichogramma brassicae]|uniref:C2H2-type domain-containing protein n=1 Tax=Trichogramma brassicae TaxID=86971 RepID=A0A6H5HVK4_9HYME|nr:unnamed protein product [Trichogramma brassicae]
MEKTPALSTCSISTEEDDEIAATASSFYHHKKSNNKQQQPQLQRQPITTKKRLYRDVLENLPRQVIPVSETMSDGSFERRYDELEKQAMEQYRTSEECLALRYQVYYLAACCVLLLLYMELEQQALEQYKAIEGSESMINLEHDRRSQASTRSSSQRGGGGACSDQDDKLSLCSNNSSVSSSTTDGQATGGDHYHHQQQQQYSSYARATTSSSSSFSNNSNNYAKRSGSSSGGDARGNELPTRQQRIKILKLPTTSSAVAATDAGEKKDEDEMTRRVDSDTTAAAAAAAALAVVHRAASEGSLQQRPIASISSTAAAVAKRFSACQGVARSIASCRSAGRNGDSTTTTTSSGSRYAGSRGPAHHHHHHQHRLANARDKIVKTSSLMSLRCNLTPIVPVQQNNIGPEQSPRKNNLQKIQQQLQNVDDDDYDEASQKKLEQRVGLLYSHQQQQQTNRKSNQQGSGDDKIDDITGHFRENGYSTLCCGSGSKNFAPALMPVVARARRSPPEPGSSDGSCIDAAQHACRRPKDRLSSKVPKRLEMSSSLEQHSDENFTFSKNYEQFRERDNNNLDYTESAQYLGRRSPGTPIIAHKLLLRTLVFGTSGVSGGSCGTRFASRVVVVSAAPSCLILHSISETTSTAFCVPIVEHKKRVYRCKVCHKKFHHRRDLQHHVYIHLKIPYVVVKRVPYTYQTVFKTQAAENYSLNVEHPGDLKIKLKRTESLKLTLRKSPLGTEFSVVSPVDPAKEEIQEESKLAQEHMNDKNDSEEEKTSNHSGENEVFLETESGSGSDVANVADASNVSNAFEYKASNETAPAARYSVAGPTSTLCAKTKAHGCSATRQERRCRLPCHCSTEKKQWFARYSKCSRCLEVLVLTCRLLHFLLSKKRKL